MPRLCLRSLLLPPTPAHTGYRFFRSQTSPETRSRSPASLPAPKQGFASRPVFSSRLYPTPHRVPQSRGQTGPGSCSNHPGDSFSLPASATGCPAGLVWSWQQAPAQSSLRPRPAAIPNPRPAAPWPIARCCRGKGCSWHRSETGCPAPGGLRWQTSKRIKKAAESGSGSQPWS